MWGWHGLLSVGRRSRGSCFFFCDVLFEGFSVIYPEESMCYYRVISYGVPHMRQSRRRPFNGVAWEGVAGVVHGEGYIP